MAHIVNVIIYDTGTQSTMPVNIDLLPEDLRAEFEPFVGQTVNYDGVTPTPSK
jgi:hypothetical protein